MSFKLPELPFAKDALAPHISPETLDYHYGKHHNAYVTNLNNLTKDTENEDKSLETLITTTEGGLFNNAAQTWNHTFFWNCLSPNSGGTPTGAVLEAINKNFGSFGEFKKQFSAASATLFGAGWAWLVQDDDKSLEIVQMSNAGNPLTLGKKPIITLDVWEHAYYIDYRNARPEFIEHFWELVNWDFALKNMQG